MINLGKAINSILTGATAVTTLTTNIYPLILPENSLLPCIVYERTSDIEYSRDGSNISNSEVNITVIASSYSKTVDIATAVFNALNNYKGSVAGINIIDCRLSSINEIYQEDSYIQLLKFSIKAY